MTAPCPTFGYLVVIEVASGLDVRARDMLARAWADFLDRRGLYCGGGGDARLEYAVASEAAQATEADREATRAWLAARPELRAWHVGDLIDLGRDT